MEMLMSIHTLIKVVIYIGMDYMPMRCLHGQMQQMF